MEEKKVRLKSKTDWKKIGSIILISVALVVLLLTFIFDVVGKDSAKNERHVVAQAEVSSEQYTRYYIVIEEGTMFTTFDGALSYNPNLVVMAMGLTVYFDGADLTDLRYFTDVMCNVNHSLNEGKTYYNTSNMMFTVNDNNDLLLTEDYKLYLTEEVYNTVSGDLLFVNYIRLLRGGNAFREAVFMNSFRIYSENVYSIGYTDGYQSGYDIGYDDGHVAGVNLGASQIVANPFISLLTPISEFIDMPLFGDFSLGSFLSVALFVSLAIIFLKLFAGG